MRNPGRCPQTQEFIFKNPFWKLGIFSHCQAMGEPLEATLSGREKIKNSELGHCQGNLPLLVVPTVEHSLPILFWQSLTCSSILAERPCWKSCIHTNMAQNPPFCQIKYSQQSSALGEDSEGPLIATRKFQGRPRQRKLLLDRSHPTPGGAGDFSLHFAPTTLLRCQGLR